ncbi:MAG: hypothetical protein M1587_07415 [Thaumarchaeota archaeon]|nr:hypothetical protein [Nitrososphaerota archaeon]
MSNMTAALQTREREYDEESETKFYTELDKLDEQAIVDDLEGTRVFEDLFYETKDHKAQLTWTGIKELRNTMRENRRAISVPDVQVVEVHIHDYAQYGPAPVPQFPCTKYCKFIGKATAQLMATGEKSVAEAEQTILMELYDRDSKGEKIKLPGGAFKTHYEVDPFARQKVVSKAKRNTIRDFIPELAITKAYEKWKALRSGQQTKSAGPAKETKQTSSAPKAVNGANVKRYFETSSKKNVQVPVNHALYDEFVNFCASLKLDHPEIEYKINRTTKLDGEEVITSAEFEHVDKDSELAKTIDGMILSIADAIAGAN